MGGGNVIRDHLTQISNDAADAPALKTLAGACSAVTEWMLTASVDDKLAGSYAYTTMLSVATAGWLMLKQLYAAQAELTMDASNPFLKAKIVTCRYYLEVMVPEALSLGGSAMVGAELLYALDAQELAA